MASLNLLRVADVGVDFFRMAGVCHGWQAGATRNTFKLHHYPMDLTLAVKHAIGMRVKRYSTVEVARLTGVHKATLLRWLYSKRLREPQRLRVDHQEYRVWSQTDLRRVVEFKKENYRKKPRRKTAGRKKVQRTKP